jgi:hypothetical protein
LSTTSLPRWDIAALTASKLVSGPPIRRTVSAPSAKFWMTLLPSPRPTMKVVPLPPEPTSTSWPWPPYSSRGRVGDRCTLSASLPAA